MCSQNMNEASTWSYRMIADRSSRMRSLVTKLCSSAKETTMTPTGTKEVALLKSSNLLLSRSWKRAQSIDSAIIKP